MNREAQAVLQHISRPRPMDSDCGCMGVQRLESGGYTPVCHCAMRWVEEVDGRFFQIIENRGSEQAPISARDMGPIGGPYLCDHKGRFPDKD